MSTILTLHDPQVARRYYAEGHWRDDTLYTLLRTHAATRGDAFALRDGTRRLTWNALARWVDAAAATLHEAGLKRGQRVCVWLPNCVEAVVVLLACSRNGYVCNPSLHQNYTVSDVAQLMERIQAAALFARPGYGADAHKSDIFAAARALPSVKRVYCVGDGPDGVVPFPAPDGDAASAPPVDTNADKIVYLAFTSGTTGLPKGVLHSDNTLLANGRAMVYDWGHDARTVLYTHSPLSHHIATVALEQSLTAGCELVLNDLASGMKPLDWIVETGATYVMGVPTHAVDILADLKRRGMARLGRVNLFYMAGSIIPPETARAFLDLGIKPQNIYGMSENGSHQYTMPDDDVETITSTCGRACRGYETRLWDADNPDIPAAPGAVGEIGTRGALLMLGYFNNQIATENSFNASGWFMSGDLGRMDSRGNLQIVGRKKDLIIRGGHNIYPAHIENLAVQHPAVMKAAAFPVSDPRLGERVCLAVVTRDGASVQGMEVLRHLHAIGLSKYDMPEFFIALDAFPLTASGKILKRELVEWTKSGRIHPEPIRWTGE
ncbi:MAG TPA: class I adenylate-forming enzyme family protein [Burkholderiales bacterium]|nr:class I adenylate-forming enzyme family protein [Burkholderiales bacterium]